MLAKDVLMCLICISTVLSKPIKTCINPHDGSELQINESYHDRCNLCTCQESGQNTCTDRTCKRRRGMKVKDETIHIRRTRHTEEFEVDFVQM